MQITLCKAGLKDIFYSEIIAKPEMIEMGFTVIAA